MTNQDLIDTMDADGARFTIQANEPEAISESFAGWCLTKGMDASNINVLDSGDIIAGSHQLTDAELVEFVSYALANDR